MRVIIPIDGSASSSEAIRFIGERAQYMSEKPALELLYVEPPVPDDVIDRIDIEALRTAYEASAKKKLAGSEAIARAAGLASEPKVLSGDCGPAIAREAKAFRAGLIAMGSRGLSPAKSFFLGSVSRSVIEHAQLPVLLVREKGLPERESLRVALAVDGSEYGTEAAEFIVENAALFGPRPTVDVIFVTLDYAGIARSDVDFIAPESARAYLKKEAEDEWGKAVRPVLDILASAGIDAEPVKRAGEPAKEIAGYADRNADIIVMGSHGWGRLKSAVLGSTATKVGALTQTPVLLVPAGVAS